MRIELINWKSEPVGWFDWDQSAGEISGPLSEELRGCIDDAVEAGDIITAPYPTRYEVKSPLTDPRRDLVLVISAYWQIPEPLAEFFPEAPDDPELPPGATF